MDFGQQIKKIRIEQNLTQEQMSQKLNVSRQAVSNWENNRNLPDIEMLITMATVFHISLDQLILGGDSMNNMTKKLIKDGSENKKKKMNMVSFLIGTALLLIGLICFVARPPVTMDDNGLLQESLLTPIAFLFFGCGFIVFLITGFTNIIWLLCEKNVKTRKTWIPFISVSIGVVLIFVSAIAILIGANSGANNNALNVVALLCGIASAVLLIYGIVSLMLSSRRGIEVENEQ